MWQRDTIPGFAEAQDSESVDRSLAFLGQTELIGGVECAQITPRRIDWLTAQGNPFIVGGRVEPFEILGFIFAVSAAFKPDKAALDLFLSQIPSEFDFIAAKEEIDESLERAFLDSPQTESGIPYFSFSSDLVTAMASSPFHWVMEKTLDTPVAIIFQLLKCRTKSKGGIVVNKRSDEVASDWLAEKQRELDATIAAKVKPKRTRKKKGVA